MKEKSITVLLAEDHRVVRKGLKMLLELAKDISVVAETEDGIDTIRQAVRLRPDVVVLDIALPIINGLDAARQILRGAPQTKILVLSAHSDDGYIEKAASIGVAGFLVKQCSPNLLIEGIREVAMGRTCFSPTISMRTKELKASNGRNGGDSKLRPGLSAREVQVLQLIAGGRANKQIASDLGISVKTVEKHRQNLMRKLAIHDTAGLTRHAIAEGFIENSRQRTIK